MKIAFIANPSAGRGRARALIDDIRVRGPKLGIDATVALTEGADDGVRLARELRADADVVGIVGGDGTVHEVINGLMPDPPPVFILAAGSGNDFASLLAGPATLDDLPAILESGLGARIDVLDFGDRFCINSAGLGFEGMVNKRSHDIRLLRGSARYLLAVFKTLSALTFPRFDIRLPDGRRIEGKKLIVSIGNGVRTGGAFYLTPGAFPDDGLIDVCIIEPMGRLKVVRLLPKSFNGSHVTHEKIEVLQVASLEIHTDPAFPMHVDGELVENAPATLRIGMRPRALPVLCKDDANNRLTHPLEKVV